jgi:hypothetical protein
MSDLFFSRENRTHGESKKCIQNFGWKTSRKRPFGDLGIDGLKKVSELHSVKRVSMRCEGRGSGRGVLLRYYPSICLGELWKTTEGCQDRSSGRESIPGFSGF